MTLQNQKIVDEVLKGHPGSHRDHLIPILQEVQAKLGYLSEDAVVLIGRHMNIPASKIYGVATFYNQFRFQPKGKFHIMLCRGTACHVKGSAKTLESLVKALRIEPGQTSRDGLFSIEVVACLGACALAPAITVNGEFFPKVSQTKLDKIIDDCRRKAGVAPAAQAKSEAASTRSPRRHSRGSKTQEKAS
jgi:NADH-quinone oxidoreductase subunit E